MSEKSIAIITARGGSKRIPGKNIKNFYGKPIILYSIEAALNSNLFDEVMVSTDDEKIAEISRKAGAQVPFYRNAKTSDDFATTADVVSEVLETYEKKGITFHIGCCIYPTAPFVTADRLRQAKELLVSSQVNTVIPVVAYSYPIQRALTIKNDLLTMNSPEYINARSQDLEQSYHDCGQFYFFKTDFILKEKKLFGGTVKPIILNEIEVQDIDNETDWKIAEMKYQLILKGNAHR